MRVPLVAMLSTAVAAACVPVTEESPDLLTRLEAAPAGERDGLLRNAIASNDGTPLIEGDTAYFFVEVPDGPPPRLVADFNGWGQHGSATMTALEGTSWYYARQTLHPAARIEYAFAPDPNDDGKLELDPENPRTVEGFDRLYSELRMPGYPDAPELIEDESLPHGRIFETEFESRIRNNSRKLVVYLPAEYDENDGERYPTAYFGDGPMYVSDLPVIRILDYAIARAEIEPLVAVFVEPMPRADEYTMNDDYRRFVVEELVPWVDARYRTIASSESRAIVGGSRGALAALDLAWFHPDVFGGCGAIAPAVSPWNLIELIREGDVRDIRFFVLAGIYDIRFRPDGVALHEVLREKGYDVEFLEIPEGHSLAAWSSYIDDVLMFLFPRKPSR